MRVMDVEGRRIVAVCDKELLGKKFEEGERLLDLDANRGFYEGELSDEQSVKAEISMADSINLVGHTSVGVGKTTGLVSDDNILQVAGIPHAQVYRL